MEFIIVLGRRGAKPPTDLCIPLIFPAPLKFTLNPRLCLDRNIYSCKTLYTSSRGINHPRHAYRVAFLQLFI